MASFLIAFAAGAALGGLYFGGLWLTLRCALRTRGTTRWLLLSFAVRAVLALAGLYGVVQALGGRGAALALCLLGFMAARLVMLWGLRPRASASVSTA